MPSINPAPSVYTSQIIKLTPLVNEPSDSSRYLISGQNTLSTRFLAPNNLITPLIPTSTTVTNLNYLNPENLYKQRYGQTDHIQPNSEKSQSQFLTLASIVTPTKVSVHY